MEHKNVQHGIDTSGIWKCISLTIHSSRHKRVWVWNCHLVPWNVRELAGCFTVNANKSRQTVFLPRQHYVKEARELSTYPTGTLFAWVKVNKSWSLNLWQNDLLNEVLPLILGWLLQIWWTMILLTALQEPAEAVVICLSTVSQLYCLFNLTTLNLHWNTQHWTFYLLCCN